jgi:hypothetical protein
MTASRFKFRPNVARDERRAQAASFKQRLLDHNDSLGVKAESASAGRTPGPRELSLCSPRLSTSSLAIPSDEKHLSEGSELRRVASRPPVFAVQPRDQTGEGLFDHILSPVGIGITIH